MDGGWSDFEESQGCTETESGDWQKTKTRSCTDPEAQYGGEPCSGEASEVRNNFNVSKKYKETSMFLVFYNNPTLEVGDF